MRLERARQARRSALTPTRDRTGTCCESIVAGSTTVQVYSVVFGWSSVGSYDNRYGSTQMWVRVHNDQTLYVRSQSL